eukprot:jgi/Tetstr1/446333/TSEL_033876.t1
MGAGRLLPPGLCDRRAYINRCKGSFAAGEGLGGGETAGKARQRSWALRRAAMDHAEEQAMELEALEAIWPDEFGPLGDDSPPAGWPAEPTIYRVDLTPGTEGEDAADGELMMQLVFQHTEAYPEEAPRLRLRSVRGLTDAEVAAVQNLVGELVEENMGMAMIYTLGEAAKEWLRDRANVQVVEELDPEEIKARAIEEEERKLAEARRLGTPVTPENFRVWQEAFEAERALERAQAPDLLAAKEVEKRMTGKQYFMGTDAAQIQADQNELGLEDDDFDFDDDDDEGMLDEYLAADA